MERFLDKDDCCILAYCVHNILSLLAKVSELIYLLSAVVRDSSEHHYTSLLQTKDQISGRSEPRNDYQTDKLVLHCSVS